MVSLVQQVKAKVNYWLHPFSRDLLTFRSSSQHERGRVLFSYVIDSLTLSDDHPRFLGHSNAWEAREIARIFLEMGFVVDAIDYRNNTFVPKTKYDIVFDISSNLGHLAQYLSPSTLKLLHLTGSDPYFQNAAELARVRSANERRKTNFKPRRVIRHPEKERNSVLIANRCSLLGNSVTLHTFPELIWEKTTPIPVSASPVRFHDDFNRRAQNDQFLWFFGSGAIHKGLDLVLDVFSANPQWTLHVIGGVKEERDFMNAYSREMLELSNIHYHGYLLPNSTEFEHVTENVFAFIAPSCSEGISPAVVTCIQAGFYPILSRNTGVDLPIGAGLYLETCTMPRIVDAVRTVSSLSEAERIGQLITLTAAARQKYSRAAFSDAMKRYLQSAVEDWRL